ncbi:MAG: hypothetical protein LBJ47_03045 [Tannerella sp.]|jgi:hypothetical protein|nr:hypothetical protein [Tannerella sp.]
MKTEILLLGFVIGLLCSCNDGNGNEDNGILKSEATVVWKGEYEVDGCGFFVKIKGKEYKPENEEVFGDDFKSVTETEVVVEYELSDKKIEKACYDSPSPPSFDGIKIITLSIIAYPE